MAREGVPEARGIDSGAPSGSACPCAWGKPCSCDTASAFVPISWIAAGLLMGAKSRGSKPVRSLAKGVSSTQFVASPCNRGVGGLILTLVIFDWRVLPTHKFVPLPNNLNPCSQALVVAHMITSVAKGFLVALDPSNPQIAAGFRVTAKPPIFGGIVWRDSGGSYLLLWGRTTPLVRWQHCAPRMPYQTSSRRMLLSLPPCM